MTIDVGTSSIIVIPTAEIGVWRTGGRRSRSGQQGCGVVDRRRCLLTFNVGAPLAGPICGAVGGGITALVGVLMNAACEWGRDPASRRCLRSGWADIWSALSVAL